MIWRRKDKYYWRIVFNILLSYISREAKTACIHANTAGFVGRTYGYTICSFLFPIIMQFLTETLVSQGLTSGKTTIPNNLQVIMKTKWSNGSHQTEEHTIVLLPLHPNILVLRENDILKSILNNAMTYQIEKINLHFNPKSFCCQLKYLKLFSQYMFLFYQ